MSVSYLISSYNKAEYLTAVLACVAKELSVTGGEVLIIDDGSSDGSWKIIEEFKMRDSRIVARRQENKGIFNVTNQLLKDSHQPWLRIIDCDDPPILGSTELLMRIAEKENADYIFGKTLTFGPDPLSRERMGTIQEQPSTINVLSDPISYAIREYNHIPSTALIRRAGVPPVLSLNEKFISCQDLALALPIFKRGRVVRIDCAVCHQLIGSSKRLSAHEALTYFQTIEIIREFGNANFNDSYKYMAARKLVSRAMRWMRHRKLIARSPLLYGKLFALYCTLHISNPKRWDDYLNRAAEAYFSLVPQGRRFY